MPKLVKTDYHLHPNYSFDATLESIDDYCRRAIELGLEQICFTPHYTTIPSIIDKYGFVRINGEKFPVTGDWLGGYINEVRQADKKYSAKGLRAFAGLEIDYCPLIHNDIKRKLTEEYDIDYMLGSIHVIDNGLDIMVPDDAEEIFRNMRPDDFFAQYFESVETTIESGLFKAIAHLEGYRRFGSRYNAAYSPDGPIPKNYFERVFKKMAARSMALEINLSLFREGQNITNPTDDVLKIAHDCGIRNIAIGSDAHTVKHMALSMQNALDACAKIGFDTYTLER